MHGGPRAGMKGTGGREAGDAGCQLLPAATSGAVPPPLLHGPPPPFPSFEVVSPWLMRGFFFPSQHITSSMWEMGFALSQRELKELPPISFFNSSESRYSHGVVPPSSPHRNAGDKFCFSCRSFEACAAPLYRQLQRVPFSLRSSIIDAFTE